MHACECAEDEVPELLVDADDAGCTLGKSCAGCTKMKHGRDYSRQGHSTAGGPRKAASAGHRESHPSSSSSSSHWRPAAALEVEGEVVAFSAAGLVGIGILYVRCKTVNDGRTMGRKYGRLERDEDRP